MLYPNLLLLLHRLLTAVQCPVTTLGNNKLSTALGAAIPLTYLIRHLGFTPFKPF